MVANASTDELDELTLRRAQRGDAAACRDLVLRYQGAVFALLGRMLGPGRAAEIEDLAQDTFLDVFRALARFSALGPARLSTWVLTIASRRSIDFLRARRGDALPGKVVDVPDASARAAPTPPEGFADAVVAAMGDAAQSRAGTRSAAGQGRWRWGLAAVAVAAVVAVVLAVRGGPRLPGAHGAVRATERSTIRLAHRGVLVAEPGAELTWRVSKRGETAVRQPRGEVFYRVDRGGPFVVETPGGRVEVTGTCFSVEVTDMKPSKQALIGAAAGAALAATIVVTVYEGRVLFARADGQKTRAVAGQTLVARPGDAPVVQARRRGR